VGYRTPDTTFGDGSDGHAHYTIAGGAVQLLPKARMQYASLEIDAGVTLKQKQWKDDYAPVCRIFCKTPIIINGIFSVSEVVGAWTNSGAQEPGDLTNNNGGAQGGFGPAPGGVGFGGIYPICGGGAMGGASIVGWVPGYTDSQAGAGVDGDAYVNESLTSLVGPDQLYRFCAGSGGGSADNDGGIGGGSGGSIVVTAPAITFGASGMIEAKGGPGTGGAGKDGSGGAGGGYVETNTRVVVPLGNLDVSGGIAEGSQYSTGGDGRDGLIVRRIV